MKQTSKILIGSALLFGAMVAGCSKDNSQPSTQTKTNVNRPAIRAGGTSLASIGQSGFSLWGTCNGHPYNITGTNGICVPVGNCSSDIDAAQQTSGQTATGFQFNGCFKGGTNASGYSEEAVFLCDNVTQWNGDEMGFVKTLNDNTLKAYVQGGGNYYTSVISTGDNGYHTFKAQCRSASNVTMVDFYVDGTYKCTLTNSAGHYWNNFDYFVGTNHWSGGSNPTGQQIEMYNMTTF